MRILQISFRNLIRQRTRLTLNLALLVGSFAALVLFKGFSQNVLETMRDILIDTQFAHIQVASESFFKKAPVNRRSESMLPNAQDFISKIEKIENVVFASPRTQFYGLIQFSEKSIPGQLVGFDFSKEVDMQKRLLFVAGQQMDGPRQVIIGEGLQKILKANPGDDVTVVSSTLNGSMNAMDLKVTGIFSTGFAEVDNSTAYVANQDALHIIDTELNDQILVKLKDPFAIGQTSVEIQSLLKPNPSLSFRKWNDLADLYNQVETFYAFQGLAITLILVILLFLSLSNTMNMTVFERSSEIGTMKALGDTERNIRGMLWTEAFVLSMMALCFSLLITYGLIQFINGLQVKVSLPLASQPLPLVIRSNANNFILASGVQFLTIFLASLWPIIKGSKISALAALRAKV